jgi:hypothetical protein
MYPDHLVADSGEQVIDTFDTEKGITTFSKETLEQVKERYPEAKVMTWDEWDVMHDDWLNKNVLTPPQRISEDRFYEMLETLPPILWRTNKDDDSESFGISEMLQGNITSFYIRIGDQYFHVNRRVSISHDDLVDLCKPLLKKKRS